MIANGMFSSSIKAVLATAFFVPSVCAQTASAAVEQTVSAICETVPPIDYSQARPFVELVLTPGQRLDLNKIAPDDMARMMALQKAANDRQTKDWANLCRYAADNAKVRGAVKSQRAVYLGDSITEYWQQADPGLFGDAVQDRGIGGQTTAQILLRFYPDVVALKPRVVHIMAGTNDVAGNLGPVADDTIVTNIAAMIDIAKANGIRVVLASIPPARFMSWKPGLTPALRIAGLNVRLKQLADARGAIFADYHVLLRDDQGGFQAALANDGVHPNRDGYAVMRPLAERAIAQAIRTRK